ncbi:MAG: right-handed parallel beta-helix repeat-containing protein, partial [Lachnospiraceae bacterium]|nr:right-handed parallel beta-helix repeat-containing protein [Lachnospiraceae bacterium]
MFSASTVKAEDNAYKKTAVDLSKGLKQGVTYGDDEIASISVLEDMSVKQGKQPIDGVSYDNYIQGKNNAKPNNGAIPTSGSAFKIKANVDSTIYFAIGTATNKKWHFVEEDTKKDLNSDGSLLTEDHYSFRLTAQKTYYFYLDGSKPKVYGISLTKGSPSIDWTKVAAPKLESPTVNGDKVTINYTASIGDQGAEKLDVNVSLDGKIIDTLTTKANGESGSISYQPLRSGNYTFEPVLKREKMEDKRGESVTLKGFVLPLSKPSITAVTDKGGGKVEVTFDSVKEAERYLVSYSPDGETYTEGQSSKGNSVVLTVPQTGKDYYFRVTAERGNDKSVSDPMSHQVNDQWKATWLYSAFGQGVSGSSKDCGYQKISDDSARVYDINGKGKLVPASTDGLSFYYTKVPSDQNFTLSADVNVNTWKYSNGQEGFGLMASDDIGENGDASVFWNNSYMASVTKVLYNYDKDKESATDDTSFPQYTMKLGVGSQEKSGVTKENLAALNNNDTTVVNRDFTSKMSTLETAAGQSGKPAGTYNIVGKRDTSSAGAGPDLAQYTSFKLQIQKNNTGYFVSYTDPSGKTKTQKYYDTKALAKLDPDYVYAGIFASRNCDVTAKNISLKTIDPKEDAPAEKIEMKKITPSFKIVSPASANGSDYTLRLTSNYDGKVTVKNSSDEAVAFGEVHKGEVSRFPVKVKAGKNTFTAVSQPNEGYQPDKFSVLSNYKENTAKISVSYFKYDGDLIYVGPDGKGNGTKKSPASIYDAVKYAAPGQTIVLLPGHYDLKSGLMIPLGTNGTKDQPIKMIADPSENSRPVLDFSQAKDTIGLEIAGDYWYLSGFDVTNAPNGKDGIHVSGSFNTLDRIHAYHNGNTGIQISRIGEQQAKEEWPAHNLILNCTSYANADAGYEDADGFAAKLTIGEGNIFDGCIAYNNADDGWDLFAKPETGSIGSVTIKNCLAYGNGYGIDGTDEGNGNGFKMGGSSLSGHHRLVNSVAFNNKAKGIDSNSCPDIEIENSISYNNGGSNVALYTTDAKNTDFSARGIISYRKGTDIAETIKPKGSQDIKKIYQASNFFWKDAKAAHDASKEVSDAWFKSD